MNHEINIIFKGEENWPHLIEVPERPNEKDYSGDDWKYSDALGFYESTLKLAKANAVPFRSDDREEVKKLCWLKYIVKDKESYLNRNWQPDPEKIYSIEGKYEIVWQRALKTGESKWKNRKDAKNDSDEDKMFYVYRQIAILLKEEIFKEDFYKYGQSLGIKINDLQRLKILATQSGIKESEKEESQDKLINEILTLYFECSTANPTKWRNDAKSKFHITRIK